jgi:hypothetical protein
VQHRGAAGVEGLLGARQPVDLAGAVPCRFSAPTLDRNTVRPMPFSVTARAACPPSRACAATGSASGTDGLIHSSASTPRVAASTASPSSWSHRTTST